MKSVCKLFQEVLSTSYRWSVYVTPKGWLKSDLFVVVIEFNFNRIICYKVSSCKNFQQQSYSTVIPRVTVHRYWRET